MRKHARPTLTTLGSTLRAFRKRRGLSQDRLANQAGVDRAYVGGIERAERHPTWEVIERLLAVLEVKWGEFGRALDEGEDLGTAIRLRRRRR